MSELLIGFSASSYFLGFVAGCLLSPHLVARVGHIRAFAVLTALMISAILCLDLFGHWSAWLLLRFLTGVAMCGLYTVIESWLNSQVGPGFRGRLLALYTVITLTAMTGGQFLINVGPVSGSVPLLWRPCVWPWPSCQSASPAAWRPSRWSPLTPVSACSSSARARLLQGRFCPGW
jgi:MFS family permease